LFRQAALDRLSDPEQLDQMLTVARPSDWVAGSALLLLVMSGIGWSLFGTVSTRVAGNGILVSEGGAIFAPVAVGDGVVVSLLVETQQWVKAGQRLARIAQPELEAQLASARAVADEDRAQLADLGRQIGSYASARRRNLDAQRHLLAGQRVNAEARSKEIGEQLQVAQGLLARGILTRSRVSDLAEQYASARQAAAEATERLMQADANEISTSNTDRRDVGTYRIRLAEATRRVGELAAELDRRQWVTSPVDGRVVEVKTPAGSRVVTGTPLVAIEQGAGRLGMIAYLPPRDGKSVRPGMPVNVSPSVAKREEFGTMKGRVVAVSDFPSTVQAMQTTLQNDQLVKDLSAEGAPIAVRVRFERAPTATGYAWAAGSGPAVPLSSGTIGVAEVTVDRQRPIAFALPFLRRAAGL
jgi:HlyD family secretion protein